MAWQPAPSLAVSPSERTILEAVVAQQQIPARVRKRAGVVLMAADGVANHKIGRELSLARPGVLLWRRRFEQQGVRGLWDVERVPSKERVPEAVEQAIVFDCLYRPRNSVWLEWDASLNWNVRNLARRHGVSRSSVERIWKKHGIRMQRYRHLDQGVDLGRLKISPDPLFGVTVYELAGLFHESAGSAVAFCSRARPFAELSFSSLDGAGRKELVDGLVGRFRELGGRSFGRPAPAAEKFIQFVSVMAAKPRHRDAEIHLLMERPESGAHAGAQAQAWLAGQKCIQVHYTPWSRRGPRWTALAERWLRVIAAWPLQARFAASVDHMSGMLARLPAGKYLDTLVIR